MKIIINIKGENLVYTSITIMGTMMFIIDNDYPTVKLQSKYSFWRGGNCGVNLRNPNHRDVLLMQVNSH